MQNNWLTVLCNKYVWDSQFVKDIVKQSGQLVKYNNHNHASSPCMEQQEISELYTQIKSGKRNKYEAF